MFTLPTTSPSSDGPQNPATPNRSRHWQATTRSTNEQRSSSRRAIAFDQVTPLRRRAQPLTRRWLDARSPFGHRRFPANGWSIYGAQRAQPVATGEKWDALENR
jgi:hypothetical protein